jgi:septum formation protein
MRNIILASGSKARRDLLRQMGIKFRVARSNIRESRTLSRGCGSLVEGNALRKARDVAPGFSSGVIIAADTVVLVGKRIIGKPADLSDARRTLKLLSRRPQWVYTGLAVIDIDGGKEYLAHERTKVWMRELSDSQIDRYFSKVSPLDKAGSFDIQGRGGLFIDRIEGCFYNVVGLPLAKLSNMLAKAGVEL